MNIQVNKEEDTDIFSVRFVSLTERDLFATGKKYATIKEKRSVSLSCQNVVGILNFIHFPKDARCYRKIIFCDKDTGEAYTDLMELHVLKLEKLPKEEQDEAREKAIRDYHSQMQGMREEDFAEGKEQGKKARKMRKVTSIITNMLRKGKSPEEIADLTGEELEEILEIKRQEPT